MKTKLFIFAFSLLLPIVLKAQTATWKMQPQKFTRMGQRGKDLFEVERNGKIGLIRSDGTPVEQTIADHISDFYEHKALLICNETHGKCILGVLSDDGIYTPFKQRYYTLTGQDFFSDGLLTVEDEQGRKGYVDENGVEVLGFDNRFDRIKPFTEGYAAVFKNKKFDLINKSGQKIALRFETVGDIAGGTNIYQGKAYLYDSNGRFYTYDVQRGGYCQSYKMPSKDYSLDYLSRFACITGQKKSVPFATSTYQGTPGPVLSQFTSEPFVDGLAIVTRGDKIGILQYEEGSFAVSTPKQRVDFEEGKTAECSFALQVPTCWQQRNYTVTLRNEQDTELPITSSTGVTRTFKVKPTAGKHTFSIEVNGEDLHLYQSSFTLQFVKIPMCPTCHHRMDSCPYHGKHPAPTTTKSAETTNKKTVETEKKCDTCHLPISKCPYQGVH